MRATRSLVLFSILAVFATPVLAEEPPPLEDFDRPGFYLSGYGNYALENWNVSNATDAYGFSLRAGYRITQWYSLELDVQWLHNFLRDSSTDAGVVNTQIKGKLYPIGGRYQPFLVGGAGILATLIDNGSVDSLWNSEADWALEGGGGIDVYITRNWVVTAEAAYVWTAGSVSNLDYTSFGLGVMYRF